MEIEIGRGKTARRAYGFDDLAIVPSRRTRDPRDVNISWSFEFRGDTFTFPLPILASAMDGVVDPAFAVTMGKLGGLAVLNLEGIQTRYADAGTQLDLIASFDKEEATAKMQEIYKEPVKAELITQRVKEIKDGGVLAAASLTPQNVERYIESDIRFHVAIARGAHNDVLLDLLETLQHIIRNWIFKSIDEVEGKPSSIQEHVPIYNAIRERDSVRARAAMNEHLEKAGQRLQRTATVDPQ